MSEEGAVDPQGTTGDQVDTKPVDLEDSEEKAEKTEGE